jgi:hypothetical protein
MRTPLAVGLVLLALAAPAQVAVGDAMRLNVEIAPATWTGPVSNAAVAITFRQHIGASDALRAGAYSKTLTFTLSTTAP